MARTLPYGICDRHGPAASAIAPLPHSPPLSPSPSADKRKLSPRRARNFARNLPPGLEQRVTVLEKLIIFCTQAEGEREREGWVDVSCSRFLVHWIMTFTVVLVVVELRCLRAKFTSFFIIPHPATSSFFDVGTGARLSDCCRKVMQAH